MTDQETFDALCEPFPIEIIEWRVGPTNAKQNGGVATKGQALAYINARAVMDRLDSVCGMGGWQRTYSPGVGSGSIICNIGIKTEAGEWIWKSDGAGATDMEAEKGAMSDAFKRAAVNFGVGRYLYDIDSPWIELENGRYIPKSARKMLDDSHEKAASRIGWGDRQNVIAYRVLLNTIKNTCTSPTDVIQFRDANKGLIEAMPVKMRSNLNEQLDRIGSAK